MESFCLLNGLGTFPCYYEVIPEDSGSSLQPYGCGACASVSSLEYSGTLPSYLGSAFLISELMVSFE